MKIVHSGEEAPRAYKKAIFLAGPTPRNKKTKSWRPEALRILEKLKYDGVVFVPEFRSAACSEPPKGWTYDMQCNWEHKCLDMADIILFWVPRKLRTMPAFTTNIEFGFYANSGKVVLGAPPNAQKMGYLKFVADKFAIPCFDTLEETLAKALEIVGEGARRKNGERFVPLNIWKTSSFQEWYVSLKNAGNRLDNARVEWVNLVGPKKDFVFRWGVRTNIFVASENRNKTNEVVVSRTDISSALLIKRELDILKSKVVLVKEFRSPARTQDGFIHELPSGSSWNNISPVEDAQKELGEETGFLIDPKRLKVLGSRQLAGTFSAHKAHVYYAKITDKELAWFEARAGRLKINDSDPTGERLYIEVKTVEEILNDNLVDWSNLGAILNAVLAN